MIDSIIQGVSSIHSADTAKKASADAAWKDLMGTILGIQAQQAAEERARKYMSPFYNPSLRAMAEYQSGVYGGPVNYEDPTGATRTANFNPQQSGENQYIKQRTLDDLGRYLRSIGRSDSTAGINATGRTISDLNVGNVDRYNNNLLNLIKSGQGAAGAMSTNAMQSGNTLAGLLTGSGIRQGQYAYDQGITQANLYRGLGQLAANTYQNEMSTIKDLAKSYGGGMFGGMFGGGK